VNNFNFYNKKENNGGYFTLYSFGEFVVEGLFLPGTNIHNKQISWTTQVNTTGQNDQPQLFDKMDCRSNRRNKTVVFYESNGESMKVTVICKKKRSIQTPNNYRLDVKVAKIDTHVSMCNKGMNCFLEHESGGTGLCFPAKNRRNKRGSKCRVRKR